MRILILISIVITLSFCMTYGQHADSVLSETDLERINRELDNPLSRQWSLVFQENLNVKSGDLLENDRITSTFFFQPALPVPIGQKSMFTARPVIPLVTNPSIHSDGSLGNNTTGLGDIQLLTLFGPDRKGGIIWGLGLTFIFPTATQDNLGQGKYQTGPSIMLLSMSKNWTLGLIGQHWNSYAGDPERPETSQTDIQYLVRRRIPGAASLGVGPTISINWMAAAGKKLVFPIGFGIVKTIKISNTPVKIKIEPQYNIIRPTDYATSWTFRLQITPVINSPFIDS